MHTFVSPAAYGKLEECEVPLIILTSQLYYLANLYQTIAFGFKFDWKNEVCKYVFGQNYAF